MTSRKVIVRCLLVVLGASPLVGVAYAQPYPAALTIVPIGGNSATGGSPVTLEIFFTAIELITVEGGQYDLPCIVAADPGGTGTMTVQSMTTDPQGDGSRGPSSNGIPFLFGPVGLGPSAPVPCITATTPSIGGLPVTLLPGEVRYIGTYVYVFSECAAGSFTIGFECTDQPGGVCSGPPEPTNSTRYRADNPMSPAPGPLIPLDLIPATITVPVGQCCSGTSCLDDGISHACCLALDPNASWSDGLTCLDPCSECTQNAHCDDGQFCSGQETCNLATGQCVAGTPPSCPGGTSCRTAFCNPALNNGHGGCTQSNRPNGTACGSSATTDCDNPDSCLNGACDPNFVALGTPCGNGGAAPCNAPDSCDGSGLCDPNLAPDGMGCDDGTFCTVNDACAGGACVGASQDCDDGLFCNGVETCDPDLGCLSGAFPCPNDTECEEETLTCLPLRIPTVSSWGLIVLLLALLAGAKVRTSGAS